LKSKVITFVVVFSSSFEFKAKDKVAETDFWVSVVIYFKLIWVDEIHHLYLYIEI
jgi:hypothetical protein